MSTSMLAEMAEADAPPEIAAIYAELRRFSGAPMAALIWRHLATLPGVLPEAWAALRPAYAEGLLQNVAWRVSEETVKGPPAAVGRGRLAAAGVDADGQAAFVRVLDAYNRANPLNFVAVRVLLHRMAAPGGSGGRAASPGSYVPPVPVGPIPAMAPIAALAGEPRRLLDELSSDASVDRSSVVPSLYRHLTAWPGLIPLIHAALIERFRSGEIGAQIAALSARLDSEASRLAADLPPVAKLAAAPGVRPVLERFSRLIPEMVVVGLLLRRGVETA